MINKKTFYFIVLFIAIVVTLILLPNSVNAVTISENGQYKLQINGGYVGACINGNTKHMISFDFDEGEEKVSIEELTKNLDIFSGGREFLGWSDDFHSKPESYITELNKKDFKGHSVLVGNEWISNCISIAPYFSEKTPVNTGTYYLGINSFLGNMNGKKFETIVAPSSSFATIDLTKYVPTFSSPDYKFLGWSINGKELITKISAQDFTKIGKDVIEVIGMWKKTNFDATSKQNIRLDANGGTIEGEVSKLINYWIPSSSSDPFYLYGYTPVRDGYTFKGWYTKADGTGKQKTVILYGDIMSPVSEGFEVDNEKYLKLYAIWEKNGESTKPPVTIPDTKPEANKVEEFSAKIEESNVEVKLELEKAVEGGSKLQIVKIAEEKIEEVKKVEKDLKTVFDINIISNKGDIVKIENNKMQIKILLEESLRGYKNYQVVYIKDGKIAEEMPTKIDGNYIVFETTHLSEYGIIANNEEKTQEVVNETTKDTGNTVQNPQTGDNILVFETIFIIAFIGLVASIKYNYNKKNI